MVKHLLRSLGNCSIFMKVDLAQAYQQLPVNDTITEAQTIVTHRGAFKCHLLQFRVSVAMGLFQSLMECLLQGIPGVIPYFNDVLVSATSKSELMSRIQKVLRQFQCVSLKVKQDKCHIAVPQIKFLYFLIDRSGIQPTAEKTKMIPEALAPNSKNEHKAFLGLLNFM